MKYFLSFIAVAMALSSFAQGLEISPVNPQAGSTIKLTYTPAGNLANTLGKVEGVVYIYGSSGRKADDLQLVKSGKKYTATIQTDTADSFIQFGFYVDKTFDNNFNQGYLTHLYQGSKVRKSAYSNESMIHQFYGQETGMEVDNQKAIVALENEFKNYPERKKTLGRGYYRLKLAADKETQKEIEEEISSTKNDGLKSETDYNYLIGLQTLLKQKEEVTALQEKMKSTFPNGKWRVNDFIQQYQSEQDISKKETMLATIEENIKKEEDWKSMESSLDFFRSDLLSAYGEKQDWNKFKAFAETVSSGSKASAFNSVAWDLQENDKELDLAEELSEKATEISHAEWKSPTGSKPKYLTAKGWERQLKNTYAMYGDTYAMVLFKKGQYKKGFELATECALTIHEGNSVDMNNTYALLAEKALPAKECKASLEKLVKTGKSSSTIKEILKRLYVAEKGKDAGYDQYIADLEREVYLEMLKEIKETVIREETPTFALKDLAGNNVAIDDLKDKIVVIDFWATWCGPCKASFPGLQKLATKYKDDASVKFLFINTWEQGNRQEKVQEFMEKNRYTFDVLMDTENKVVEQFKVNGIPTKFVIDKSGKIRFKSVGFGGNDEKMVSELEAMITMLKDGSI